MSDIYAFNLGNDGVEDDDLPESEPTTENPWDAVDYTDDHDEDDDEDDEDG